MRLQLSIRLLRDPVDETAATLPRGWRGRLVNLPAGVARGEKDIVFTRELGDRGIVSRDRLLALLDQAPVSE